MGCGWCLRHFPSLIVWPSCKFAVVNSRLVSLPRERSLRSGWTGCPPPRSWCITPAAPPTPATSCGYSVPATSSTWPCSLPCSACSSWRRPKVGACAHPRPPRGLGTQSTACAHTAPPPAGAWAWRFPCSSHVAPLFLTSWGVDAWLTCPPRCYDGRAWWGPHASSSPGNRFKGGLFGEEFPRSRQES